MGGGQHISAFCECVERELTKTCQYNPLRGIEMIPRAAWYLVEKAERAKLHLDAFNGHVSAYMKEPYTVVTQVRHGESDDTSSGFN